MHGTCSHFPLLSVPGPPWQWFMPGTMKSAIEFAALFLPTAFTAEILH